MYQIGIYSKRPQTGSWTPSNGPRCVHEWRLQTRQTHQLNLQESPSVNKHHELRRGHRVLDHRQWRHCIFSDEPRFSLYHSEGRVRVPCRQGERVIVACVQPNDGNRGPSVMVQGAIHHGGRIELVMMDGAMNQHRYMRILRNQMLSWATGVFGRNFVYFVLHFLTLICCLQM